MHSPEYRTCEFNGIEGKTGLNLYDVLMIDLVDRSTDYIEEVKRLACEADIIMLPHPYLYVVKDFVDLSGKLIIYDSQNVEYLLKKDYVGAQLAKKVFDVERDCWKS
jgi:hypothetical protein